MQKKFGITLILFAALSLRLISLNQSFWLDEAIQAVISTKPVLAVNHAADFQPPLYYILTHILLMLGIRSEWFLRLPSVFFGVLTVWLLYIFVKKIAGRRAALIAALLLSTAPYHIYFSQEFRMYSFFTFLILLSWYLLYEKKWLFYSIVIAAAIFTHYFSFIVLISQLLYLLFTNRKSLRHFVFSLIPSVVLFYFWLPTFQKQLETARNLVSVWPKWKEVSSVSFLKFPFLFMAKTTAGMISLENKVLYACLVLIIITIFFISVFRIWYFVYRKKYTTYDIRHTTYGLLFCYFLVPIVIAWISGLFLAANSPHRLIFVLPAFYAIIGIGLTSVIASGAKQSQSNVIPADAGIYTNRSQIPTSPSSAGRGKPGMTGLPRRRVLDSTRLLTMTSIVIILLSNILFSFIYLFNSKNHRENWQEAVTYTDKGGGVVLSEFIDPFASMIWYSKKPEKYFGASTTMYITSNSIKSKLDPILSTSYNQPSTIYLYTYLFEISDPQQLVENYLLQNKYKLTEETDFRGVGIIKIFNKNLK